ncbi:MAG TPA: twitching motility protein PilT [Methanomassiliicoccales archaeon]|jgi:rRNA-processing protein FCF1|nr:twitching motility protein PilT [Methanomassiliicoccales archaeon]MCE5261819.1 twitching motility protein PilT [Euryarchaeota archaeon]HOE53001.1 twitching motility protein PilT [Methanomassiliicoccales archaeon]HOO04444.1 twitching motility protein PilT [Methanomassiliicoccales archaeon]HPD08802.1 twitching motility protein PilT [Methanomassiliicoccales archaeon]
MQKVVLDTNALLMPFEFKMNLDLELAHLFGEFEAYVPGPVIGELKRSGSKHAKAALMLAGKYKRFETSTQGDAGVLEAAKALDAMVVTNDIILRRKMRKEGVHAVLLRSRRHLVIEE